MYVLVVDDHHELLELVARSLERDRLEVLTATTGRAARKLIGSEPIRLMILDLGLPDGSGIDLCRTLRAEGRRLPILVLTAKNAVASRVECLDAGADDHLSKPFAVAELRARVRALLRRAGTPAVAAYRRGHVRLDFAARRATRGEAVAPITAREWSILEILVAARGEVVSRDQLLELAWPDAAHSKAASLEVLISRIRNKLGGDLIRTLRGEGYALAPSESEDT